MAFLTISVKVYTQPNNTPNRGKEHALEYENTLEGADTAFEAARVLLYERARILLDTDKRYRHPHINDVIFQIESVEGPHPEPLAPGHNPECAYCKTWEKLDEPYNTWMPDPLFLERLESFLQNTKLQARVTTLIEESIKCYEMPGGPGRRECYEKLENEYPEPTEAEFT